MGRREEGAGVAKTPLVPGRRFLSLRVPVGRAAGPGAGSAAGGRAGLTPAEGWREALIPRSHPHRSGFDIITMTTAAYEHTNNRDEIDKRLACHEKYNKFLI